MIVSMYKKEKTGFLELYSFKIGKLGLLLIWLMGSQNLLAGVSPFVGRGLDESGEPESVRILLLQNPFGDTQSTLGTVPTEGGLEGFMSLDYPLIPLPQATERNLFFPDLSQLEGSRDFRNFSEVSDAGARQDYNKIHEISENSPKKYKGLNENQMWFLYASAVNHKVASLRSLYKYDPEGIIGFCFGRAMAVHLISQRMGLQAQNVRKLFAIGDLRSSDAPEWRFHVTTLVKGAQESWYAVDPIMHGPIDMAAWIRDVQGTWDRKRRAKFYITSADAVLPDLRIVPDLDKEAGEHIIEIGFDPENKPGFKNASAVMDGRTPLFELDRGAAQKYFSVVEEDQGEFRFLEIEINGQRFHYRGYFLDLLSDLATAPDERFRPSRRDPAMKAFSMGGSLNLFSPRLHLLLKRSSTQ